MPPGTHDNEQAVSDDPASGTRPNVLVVDKIGATPLSPKGHRTRQRLIKAARVVFERDGFLDARVADIATEASLAHGSFYTYFTSKAEVFRAVLAEVMTMIYDTENDTEGNESLTPYERIERGNRQFIDAYRENCTMLKLMEQAQSYDTEVREIRMATRSMSVERIRRSIERMQQQGIVRTDLDPACAASGLVSMVSNFIYFWLVMGEGQYENELAVRTMTQLWASALELKYS